MEFKLVLIPQTPESFILNAEKPLAGLAFVQKASECLRRNLDTEVRARHVTLGALSQYEISVPQTLAIESGWFETSNKRYLSCEADVLSKYVFYGATMTRVGANRPCYPYYQSEVCLVSYIDELAFLDVWRNRGYPEKMHKNYGGWDIPIVPDAGDVDGPTTGDMVLDDLLQGVT